jgi:hypothetical protein
MAEQKSEIMIIELPDIVKTDPKYRIDCALDIDEYRSFCALNLSNNRTLNITNQSCIARGCIWDSNAEPGITICYIPLEQGGYGLIEGSDLISNTIIQYKLTRLSTKLSHIRSIKHETQNSRVQTRVGEGRVFCSRSSSPFNGDFY